MSDFKLGTIVWGSVVAVLIICITIGCWVSDELRTRGEKQCLDAGKSLVWTKIQGVDSAQRECK